MDIFRPLQENETTTLSFPEDFDLYIGTPRDRQLIKNPTIPGMYILSKMDFPYFTTNKSL